jgi:hypothetical protein
MNHNRVEVTLHCNKCRKDTVHVIGRDMQPPPEIICLKCYAIYSEASYCTRCDEAYWSDKDNKCLICGNLEPYDKMKEHEKLMNSLPPSKVENPIVIKRSFKR